MPQAGLHGLTGMAMSKLAGKRDWLLLGTILGTMLPDMDNVAVAVAVLAKADTHGLHRTFTHSVLFVALIMAVFYIIAMLRKQPRWANLGFGLGIGVTMHILLDLLGWFNGVYVVWPIDYELDFWKNATPPDWFMTFLEPFELFMFAVFLYVLSVWARRHNTDAEYANRVRNWIILELVLFLIFTPLAYIMTRGFLTIFGAVYLFSLFLVFFITIRMRKTVNAASWEGG